MAKNILFNHKMCYNESIITNLIGKRGVCLVTTEKLEQLRYELNTEKQRGALADANKIAEIERQIAEIEQATAAKEMAYILDNLRVGDETIQDFFLNDTEDRAKMSYAVVREEVQRLLMEREQYWKEQHDQIQAQYELERAEREKAQASEATAAERNVKLLAELNEAQLMLSDAESKRDAAVAQAEEKDETIERLNKEVAELKKQLSVVAVAAPKTVDGGEAYARWKEQRKREEEAKPAIYDVEWVDNKRSTLRAKLASTGEEITFSHLEKGKYREVSAEEAPQFRITAEEPQRDNADLAQPESVEETSNLKPPSFPNEEEEGRQLAEGDVAGSTAEETEAEVTRAEFEALKQRVAALEVTKAEVA